MGKYLAVSLIFLKKSFDLVWHNGLFLNLIKMEEEEGHMTS